MKKPFLSCLLAFTVLQSAFAAEPGAVSLSIKESLSQKCEQENCTALVKGNASFAHTIALTPEEEAGLQEDTTISINLAIVELEFTPGQDPNFQNGDTLAKMKVPVEVFGDIVADANVQLKWGNGELKIKVTLAFSGETEKLAKNLKQPKEPNGTFVQVIAVKGVDPVFAVEKFVTGDEKETGAEFESAEGNQSVKLTFSFKSREVPVPSK